jgi:hypothetical protein
MSHVHQPLALSEKFDCASGLLLKYRSRRHARKPQARQFGRSGLSASTTHAVADSSGIRSGRGSNIEIGRGSDRHDLFA